MPPVSPNAPLVLRLVAGIALVMMAAPSAAAQPGSVSLSGRVSGAAGTAIAGVTLTVTGGPIPVLPVTTGGSGTFAVAGLAPAVYTVTPSRAGFVYTPASRTVTLLDGDAGLDFVEAAVAYTISGQVVDATGAAVAGAGVAIDGAAPASTTTDAAGRFAFFRVPPGGPVTIDAISGRIRLRASVARDREPRRRCRAATLQGRQRPVPAFPRRGCRQRLLRHPYRAAQSDRCADGRAADVPDVGGTHRGPRRRDGRAVAGHRRSAHGGRR